MGKIGIVYSKLDETGTNMTEYLARKNEFEEIEGNPPLKYRKDNISICEIDVFPFEADFIDSLGFDLVMFLSKHESEVGISLFSTHSLGNWTNEARVGGKPKQLSYAAPIVMLAALTNLNLIEENVEKVYEATHHGPLLKTPSFFVELGGNEEMRKSRENAQRVADAAYLALTGTDKKEDGYKKVVIGIGSNHYPKKFSALALEKGYAFSHIMPKYAMKNNDGTGNLDMLEQVLERSIPAPESAVIEWKSLNSSTKEETIKKLDEIGLDYEKI
ncbi:MAG: D-aminoacyl-tRNA deacylase [Candidatus Micrarchaeales archaeon]|jgi:D-aminoacyl-tRNA deacylase